MTARCRCKGDYHHDRCREYLANCAAVDRLNARLKAPAPAPIPREILISCDEVDSLRQQLAAAQTAIQRVQELCSARQSFLAPNEPALTVPEVRRALDTPEES